LERLRDFPLLNLDLIYGHPVQTLASWRRSVRQASQYEPEEIFLYPLYVRPGTGLGRQGRVQRAASAHTRELYRAGREILLEAGYEQFSMRCFQKPKPFREAGPQYCCQTDGMVGLGCGARSYTTHLHYANRFAVETAAVQTILEEWIAQPDAAFQKAYWGIPLSHEDRQRRFVIQSLLNSSGLDSTAFTQLFGLSVAELFPQLPQWAEAGFAECTAGHWRLTTLGMEWSDALGPALYSAASRAALEAFAHP
jgi:oxygen-independent coproporphyrinogen-3 oxidase